MPLRPAPLCDHGESPDLSDPQLPPLWNEHRNASCQKPVRSSMKASQEAQGDSCPLPQVFTRRSSPGQG